MFRSELRSQVPITERLVVLGFIPLCNGLSRYERRWPPRFRKRAGISMAKAPKRNSFDAAISLPRPASCPSLPMLLNCCPSFAKSDYGAISEDRIGPKFYPASTSAASDIKSLVALPAPVSLTSPHHHSRLPRLILIVPLPRSPWLLPNVA